MLRLVVIGHGSSNARAIRSAVRIVREFSEHGASDRIEEGIAQTHARELELSDEKFQVSKAGD